MNRYRWWSIIAFGLVLFSVDARSAEYDSIPLPQISLKLISPTGQVEARPDWPVRAEWRWEEFADPGGVPYRRPFLRIVIQTPRNVELGPVGDLKAKAGEPGKHEILLDSQAMFVPIPLRVSLAGSKGQSRAESLMVTQIFAHTPFLLDPACGPLGIDVIEHKSAGRNFFSALSCSVSSGIVHLNLLGSEDSHFLRVTGMGHKISAAPTRQHFAFREPSAPIGRRRIGVFAASTSDVPGESLYSVTYEPTVKVRRLSKSIGASLTYLNYRETVGGTDTAKITMVGLTGKFAMNYVLSPRKFDLGGNAYVTLLPLKLSSVPTTLSPARFYGINLRFGYRLPTKASAGDWSVAAGYYFWGMLVPGSLYGLASLSGPQAFLTYKQERGGHRSWYGYLKVAPISDGSSVGFSNREVALGGGYQLTSPRARRNVMLTFDVSQLSFKSSQFDNQISLNTLSLGVQMGL